MEIQVTAEKQRDELHLTISNSESTLSTTPSTGIGLRNCRERLQLIYGARARLDLTQEGGGVITQLTLPYAAA